MKIARALLVAVVLAGLTLGFVVTRAQSADSDGEARKDALAAATMRVPLLLSYENTTLRDDLARAAAQTTGRFADDYRTILSDVVEPTAAKRGISTKAVVSAAGVVSGDRDEVVVLVFLTQTTTARGNRSSVSGSRVEVTMRPDGAGWKIAGLKPV